MELSPLCSVSAMVGLEVSERTKTHGAECYCEKKSLKRSPCPMKTHAVKPSHSMKVQRTPRESPNQPLERTPLRYALQRRSTQRWVS